ncbi:MAG: hypothetical protein LM588_04490 [Fervidicoccaceae archaeon]|jgi:hypothetical protein|nr:hypothetical protein [Fervidicoccaceae archaeon]
MSTNEEKKGEKSEEKKIIAIRGIDERLYKEAARISREIGWTIGELINQSLKLFLATFPAFTQKIAESTEQLVVKPTKEFIEAAKEAVKRPLLDYYLISDLEEVVLSKKDLEELDKPLVIASVQKVIVDRDVDFDLFDSKILYLQFVDEVVVPSNYPKVRLYTKLKHVKKVSFT